MNKPWEDCNRDRLPFYTPVQAAIRWCALTEKEAELQSKLPTPGEIRASDFPEYPCLHLHFVQLTHALDGGLLAYGRDGKPVIEGDVVAKARRTIEHAQLKEWLRSNYPADAQKPHMAWLFDDVERSVHVAVTSDAYAALKAENDALKLRLEKASTWAKEQMKLSAAAHNQDVVPRERNSMLRLIRALDIMAKLPERGAAVAVVRQLEELGFSGPAEATIRKFLDEGRTLESD